MAINAKGQRRKGFHDLVEGARQSDLPQLLDLYGEQPTSKRAAIEVDWLHVLLSGLADLTEGLRLTAPELARTRNRKLRRKLALLVATAEEWEKRL